jgi:hypothetical protein
MKRYRLSSFQWFGISSVVIFEGFLIGLVYAVFGVCGTSVAVTIVTLPIWLFTIWILGTEAKVHYHANTRSKRTQDNN